MRAVIILSIATISCGGRVYDEPENRSSPDAGAVEKVEQKDASGPAAASPPSTGTTTPVADSAPAPAPDASKPEPTDAGLVSCSDGPATGSPTGCGPSRVCNAGDAVTDAWAQDLLSCFVDRCSVATTGKPWCGTIGLEFGTDGCTSWYNESGPGTGGCVKYQGYYRAWPCLAGRRISVTRPCP